MADKTIGFDRTDHVTDFADDATADTFLDLLTHEGQVEVTIVEGDDGQATFADDAPSKNPFDHGLDVVYGESFSPTVQHKRTDDHEVAGADLTEFRSPEGFAHFLQAVGLDPYWDYARVEYQVRGNTHYKFVWSHDHLLVVTGNNPLTGAYSNPKSKGPEPGYASYMGFEGTHDAIQAVTGHIDGYTVHIKEGPVVGERGFI